MQFSALVADPALYDGKRVRVAGWVTLEPESYNLWESPGFQDGFDTDHCISLQNYERFWSKESKFNRRWVVASGVFYADATGGRPMVRLNACSKLALALDEGREFEFARKRRGRE
jgi:hypothetical protein